MRNNYEFNAIKVDALDDESNSEFDHSHHDSCFSSENPFSDSDEED